MKINLEKHIGILTALSGVIMFSSKAIMVKMAYQFDIDTVTLLLFRMLFALPIYLVIAFIYFSKIKQKLNHQISIQLVLFGILGYYLASYFDFLGLKYIKASIERVILFIYPTIVVFLSYIFLKKKITRTQSMAIGITYVGVILIYFQEPNFSEPKLILGIGLIMLSALTYATYLVGSDWLIPKLGSTIFTSLAMIVSCICVIFHYAITGDFHLNEYPSEVYLLSLGMAIFTTVIPSYLVSFSIKKLGASNFSIIASFGPVSTIILAAIFLEEVFSFIQVIGTLIVIFGIYIVTKKNKATH